MDNSKKPVIHLKIIAPERIFYDDYVDMVELNTVEGELGVLPGHIPLTTIIEPGILRITKDDEEKEAALLSGFMEIKKDSITILAEACAWPEEIDINRAKEARIRAERRLKGLEGKINIPRAEISLKRSIARLDLADKYR